MKYKNIKIKINWIQFNSQIEATVYEILIQNNIKILSIEPIFILQNKFEYKNIKYREIKYKSDLLVEYNGEEIIIEIKWFETPEWKIKKKLFIKKLKDEGSSYIFLVIKNLTQLKKYFNI